MTDTITVTGNVATDPEQRSVSDGATVTSFRLAATHRRFDRATNSWIDAYTNYYSVSAFRSLGEHALASLHRGERVIVTGRFRLREWDNGTKRGVSADIDAEAIGHDLLFGTTVFHRGGSSSRAIQPEPESAETAAVPGESPGLHLSAAVDGDGWAIPAATALDPVPVTAAARLESADTPF